MAKDDHESVIDLTRELVAIPSRGGVDNYDAVLDHIAGWLIQRNLPAVVLRDEANYPVALACEIRGAQPGPRWVLDACLDTAPFGNEDAWTHPPTKPVIENGWLWGRGSADSKAAVAIFSHIATHLHQIRDTLTGTLVLLFDVDEHSGRFGGAKTYFDGPDAPRDVAGVMIGYPGLTHLVIGGRGVHRTNLHVHGVASHSGGRTTTPNAIHKAAQLIDNLAAAEIPGDSSGEFPLPGKLTVTAITGGTGYSATPDLCSVFVDIRTTPTFDDTLVTELLRRNVAQLDIQWPGTEPTLIEDVMRWPPYALNPNSPLPAALLTAAESVGIILEPRIAGPSNIGNYLAGLNIEATAGLGVDYIGLHGTDERIRIDTIPLVQATYHAALSATPDFLTHSRLSPRMAIPRSTRNHHAGKGVPVIDATPSNTMRDLGIIQDTAPILAQAADRLNLPREADLAETIVADLATALHRVGQVHSFAKGMGIAAPQLAIAKRVAVVQPPDIDAEPIVLLNPQIVARSDEQDEQYEGCLSFFDVRGLVPRSLRIVVESTTLTGKLTTREYRDAIARLIQHEIDHLDGILYTSQMRAGVKPIPVEQYRQTGQTWSYER